MVRVDALTDDDYVPFVFPSTSTQLEADTSVGGALHRASKDEILMYNHTGWPPPAPKTVAEEWVDDWDGEPHIKHTWQPDPGEWSTEWDMLEGQEGGGGEFSMAGAGESGDIMIQAPINSPPFEHVGGKLRKDGKRPTVAAKKEKMRCEAKEKMRCEVARREQRQLENSSKIKEVQTTKKKQGRAEKLAAAEKLRAMKEKDKRLAKRAKWASVGEAVVKQAEFPEGLGVSEKWKQGQVEEGQFKEEMEQMGDVVVTGGEQGRVDIGQVETKVEARAEAKYYQAKRRGFAYKANNHKTPFRRRPSPALQEAHPLTSQPPAELTSSPDLALPYKRTHRGRRALPVTRRSGHSPPGQNNYRGHRIPALSSAGLSSRERKRHDPSIQSNYWHLPTPKFDIEPTRLQKYIASKPRKTLESWMVNKAILQAKFRGAQWDSKKKLSPAAREGIKTLHKNHPEYTTAKLSELFEISPEVVRRVLRSKWEPDTETQEARLQHWVRRGGSVFQRWEELGVVQTKRTKKGVRDRRREREAKWGKQEDGGMKETDNLSKVKAIAGRIV